MLRDSWTFEYKIGEVLAAAKDKVAHYEKQLVDFQNEKRSNCHPELLKSYQGWVTILTAKLGNPYVVPLKKTGESKVQDTLNLDYDDWLFFFGDPK